jgi:uncharacterized protein (DUF1499 family)
MSHVVAIFPTPFAAWSRRVALFTLQLALLALVLHRFAALPTPVTLNLFATALAGAAIAILLGLIAFVIIWRKGRSGAWSAAAGVLFSLLLFAWPAAYLPFFLALPPINDITTDPVAPPRFIASAKQRTPDANAVNYGGPAVAGQQAAHYADIRPIVVLRPVNQTLEAVQDAVRRMRWRIIAEDPPLGKGRPGYIEAIDRTLVLGFTDDIVIRIDGDQRETRIDVRSASRYGRHDLGRNASRVRAFLKEVETQVEQASLAADRPRRRRNRPGDAVPKRQRGGPALSAAQSKLQGRAQPGAQRAPPPKERPR